MKRTVFAAAAVLGFAGYTYASPLGYTSTFDPADVLFNASGGACTSTNHEDATTDTVAFPTGSSCESLTYSHQLVGYTSPPYTLLSATLNIYFEDDGDHANPNSEGNPESVTIELDPATLELLSFGEVPLNDATQTKWTPLTDIRGQIFSDGTLSILLGLGETGRGQNDFRFRYSELIGTWDIRADDEGPRQNVPEPASLLLVGSGIGGGLMRIRRRRAES